MSALSSNTLRTEPVGSRDGPMESRPDLPTVRRLQHVRGFPAVSILLATAASDRLTTSDAATLEHLIAQATERLRTEAPASAAELGHRLRSIADQATSAPTDEALALYAHATHTEIVRLPIPVRDRAVVAETFAAGDLVMAFRHSPHYLLLLLGNATARLFDGHGRRLEERNAEGFRPVNLHKVDAAVNAIAPYDTIPIVLAGEPSLCAAFLDITMHPERVVGTVRCDHLRTGLDAAGRLAGRLLDRHMLRFEQESLAALATADAGGQLITGVTEVWPAVIRGLGQTLLVEESMMWPARISGDGLGLLPARPEGGRGVVADVIGELAWAVTFYGGEVVVLPRGVLTAFDGIALIVRSDPTLTRKGGSS